MPCLLVGDISRSLSKARPQVTAGLRDIDAEERSDVSARSLNERNLLG
ncbi:shikimate dehydrogenase [Streptococcus sanguinis]